MSHTTFFRRASQTAPAVSAILLVALLVVGGLGDPERDGLEEYMAEVRAAIEAIPLRIGAAVGTDTEPTQAAVRLLSPNKILQRRFLDPFTGESKSLLIVHCGDVRDMQGHYPPVCYPAHGWISGPRRSIPIEIDGNQVIAVVYEFRRTDELVERTMTVANFFILPGRGANFVSDMDGLQRVARLRGRAGLGVAQVQIVLDGSPDVDTVERKVRELVPVVEPVARAIGRGVER
jgi:hypothetical protein